MLKKIINKFFRLFNLDNQLNEIKSLQTKILHEIEIQKILTIQSVIKSFNNINIGKISEVEFKVFSQWGDDGLIQYLINHIDIPENAKTFIEFGVEDYSESNTRFLLLNNNWRGLVLDGSVENIKKIKQSGLYHQFDLTAISAFIDAENINELIKKGEMQGEIGILSIDIDGNDYWVWQAINIVNPIIVIVEYNAVFGNERAISIPYKKDFYRTDAHFSNLYFGASLPALYQLAQEKGYGLIGCTSSGNNAYFIRKDKIGKLKELNLQEAFVDSKFRESRDKQANLTHLSRKERLNQIKGLPVINTLTQQTELL